MNNLIIFDLDGVITSEEAYWDAAGLTLHELLYSPRYWGLGMSKKRIGKQYHPASTAQESRNISRTVFPEPEILALKGRSINSNWDTSYVAVCLHLIDLLRFLPDCSSLLPLRPWNEDWISRFRKLTSNIDVDREYPTEIELQQSKRRTYADPEAVFNNPIFRNCIGLELINHLDAFASEELGFDIENVFSRYSPFWEFCRNIFQEWYLGDTLYTKTYGQAPFQSGKPGCIHYEKPLLPLEQIRASLEALREQRYVLGFATGRVYQEAVYPLRMYGLLEYFDEQHISTYDDVERAEAELRNQSDPTLLSKPNPFPFLLAVDRNLIGKNIQHESFVVVGDSTSDILGGHAAGAMTVAVMTGARTMEARTVLAQTNPDYTIEAITKLPELLEDLDSLATIQHLQFSDKEKAEQLLQRWFGLHMNIKAESSTLMPKAVSLNSFNGIYRADGAEYFFKTHIEDQGILEEYYNAEQLHLAGYNIVRPLRTIHEQGQQMVIYPVVRWPLMFDLMRAVEIGTAEKGIFELLVAAEKQECERLLEIYRSTYAQSTAEEHSRAPIHQLFWHRLTGGRFKSFYEGKLVPLPNSLSKWKYRGQDPLTRLAEPSLPLGTSQKVRETWKPLFEKKVSGIEETSIPFNELLRYHWIINGTAQQRTLGDLVERAKIVLNPARKALTVVGHGDAHFGNVFLENHGRFLYFDPAFAGRHSPLLDVIKPLFHNVFAMWMYFPAEIERDLQLTVSRSDMAITIDHNYLLTPVRQSILQTKVEHLLRPLIKEMLTKEALPSDWAEIMQLALMCCPLLTMNLLDEERMPPSISWLGLLLAVQIGNSGIQSWGYDL